MKPKNSFLAYSTSIEIYNLIFTCILMCPYKQAIWRPPPARGLQQPMPPGINLFPEAVALSKAVALYIKDSDWNTYTLLYDDDQGNTQL